MNQPWIPAPDATSDFGLGPFVGELAFIGVAGYHPGVPTRHSKESGSPAIRTFFIPLTGQQAGRVFPDVLIFNSRFHRRLRSCPGQTVLGRIVLEATAGNDAYELAPPTPQDEQLAGSYVQAYPAQFGDLHAALKPIYEAEERRLSTPPEQRQQNQPQQQQRTTNQGQPWAQQNQQQPQWNQNQSQPQQQGNVNPWRSDPQWGQQNQQQPQWGQNSPPQQQQWGQNSPPQQQQWGPPPATQPNGGPGPMPSAPPAWAGASVPQNVTMQSVQPGWQAPPSPSGDQPGY